MEEIARQVAGKLSDQGFVAYFAGGCVRDSLLGIEPKDYDIATNATPAQVQTLFPRTVSVGAHFGVVIVLEGGHEFQVATFRADGAYIDGRHPQTVTFSSQETDALRRDFTVNGLFLDPATDQVIDFTGGRRDLECRILRAIGDPAARFEEDRLRMLRAVRFAASLDFRIDPGTWEAVRDRAASIHSVSPERIRDELGKILVSPRRVRGFDLLDESGLLAEILPEVAATKGCEQPPQFHPEGDVFVHTRLMLELLAPDASLELVLAVLFHDIGKPPTMQIDPTGRIRFNGHESVSAEMTRRIMKRLRFPNETSDAVVEMVQQHMVFKDVQNMRVARLKRFMARPTFEDELELHRVDCASSHGDISNLAFLKAREEEFANEPLIPKPYVTGRDLIALGLPPGPRFKPLLEAALNLQIEGSFPDREAALAWVREELRSENPC